MASAGSPPALPPMDGILGALSVAAFISCFLFGITTVQLYLYWQRFPKDRVSSKVLVSWCWLIDALQTAFNCHIVYYYTVSHYADPSVLTITPPSMSSMSLLEALVGGPVEVFFAIRVYKLSKGAIWGKLVTGIIVATAIIHFALGIVFSWIAYAHPNIVYWETHLKRICIVGLTSAAISDVFIAASMYCFLHARRTEFTSSRGVVNKLMMYSVESGTLTSVCAVAVVICFLALTNQVAAGLMFLLPKLYVNSLMAMLNSRQSFRGDSAAINGAHTQQLKFRSITSQAADHIHLQDQPAWRAQPANIQVDIETVSDKAHPLGFAHDHTGFTEPTSAV